MTGQLTVLDSNRNGHDIVQTYQRSFFSLCYCLFLLLVFANLRTRMVRRLYDCTLPQASLFKESIMICLQEEASNRLAYHFHLCSIARALMDISWKQDLSDSWTRSSLSTRAVGMSLPM